jgi:hypothetical protein
VNRIQIFYDYLFYSLYRFWESAPSKWWSDWKSSLTIATIKVFLLSGIFCLVLYTTKLDLIPENRITPIILALLIYGFDYYYFLYQDKWKKRIKKFQNLNPTRDKIGITIIILMISLIVGFMAYSYYLLSTVDWEKIK